MDALSKIERIIFLIAAIVAIVVGIVQLSATIGGAVETPNKSDVNLIRPTIKGDDHDEPVNKQ